MNTTRFFVAAFVSGVFATGVVVGVAVSGRAENPTRAPGGDFPVVGVQGSGRPGNATEPVSVPDAVARTAKGSVPGAVLRTASGREVAGGRGTYCWGSICADMVGPISNPDPFPLVAGETFHVDYEAGQPTATHESWRAVTGAGTLIASGDRLWKDVFPNFAPGPAASAPPTLAPGTYLYVVFAQWRGQGDVSYAWYVQLQ